MHTPRGFESASTGGSRRAPIIEAGSEKDAADAELDTILTSFDTNYAWSYGNLKEGLRDLYEKS